MIVISIIWISEMSAGILYDLLIASWDTMLIHICILQENKNIYRYNLHYFRRCAFESMFVVSKIPFWSFMTATVH